MFQNILAHSTKYFSVFTHISHMRGGKAARLRVVLSQSDPMWVHRRDRHRTCRPTGSTPFHFARDGALRSRAIVNISLPQWVAKRQDLHRVGTGDLPAGRSRSGSDNHAGCHSLPSRRFATPTVRLMLNSRKRR